MLVKFDWIIPIGGTKYRTGTIRSTVFNQYLAMSQKWCRWGPCYYRRLMET